MTKNEFNRLFKLTNGFYLTKDYIVFRKPLELWNQNTDESISFKSLEELLNYKINDITVESIILQLDDLYIETPHSKSKTGGTKQKEFKFSHAREGKGKKGEQHTTPLLPAYANTQIKSKTLKGAMDEFREKHKLSNREFAYEVDGNGYVHQYVRGQASSVGISSRAKMRKGERTMILHNHPSGGAFSDSDLISTSMDGRSKGIVASGKKYNYIFEKGNRFKANDFVKAVKNAKMKGKDYDDAVDKWLKKNQKQYGYKYTREK